MFIRQFLLVSFFVLILAACHNGDRNLRERLGFTQAVQLLSGFSGGNVCILSIHGVETAELSLLQDDAVSCTLWNLGSGTNEDARV